jgi:hypothetical protein
MAYHHWLAQERFRQRMPEVFAQLPAESVRQCMVDPVLRVAKEAHYRRDDRGYARLLRLAHQLAPHDPEIRRMWHKRWFPMSMLRAWDRISAVRQAPAPEAS